ncbi:unnamed protein product [Phytophthora fragariaefolia]|uniref:Unnamed protein product n=1 Tax=Phytophthora fragariaefolia TaxID=1490495 RepID=A0A9W6TXE8_9STRA|nr:unnamed protein product [Phytophthora fragariaefolia]
MELSNLQFKVHHKPGTTMGHVDGLSRLPMESVNALTMADLLNPEHPEDNGGPSSVGEPSETGPEPEVVGQESGGRSDSDSEPELEDDDELELEYATESTEEETGEASTTPVTPSSVDVFGLDSELFLAEQQGGDVDQGARGADAGWGCTPGSVPKAAYRADGANALCLERPAVANRPLAGQCWTSPHGDCSGGAASVREHGVALLPPRLALVVPRADEDAREGQTARLLARMAQGRCGVPAWVHEMRWRKRT